MASPQFYVMLVRVLCKASGVMHDAKTPALNGVLVCTRIYFFVIVDI